MFVYNDGRAYQRMPRQASFHLALAQSPAGLNGSPASFVAAADDELMMAGCINLRQARYSGI